MTNTPMSEQEKELVEAVREFRTNTRLELLRSGIPDLTAHINRLMRAIKAYDPKPEKEYTMPEWDDFVRVNSSITGGKAEEGKPYETWGWVLEEKITKTTYNAIREALSKSKAPTE